MRNGKLLMAAIESSEVYGFGMKRENQQEKHGSQTEDWSEDSKAGGADNVFKSRLPRPMRIRSLDDAATTEETLLTLALTPLVKELKALECNKESQISKIKAALVKAVNEIAEPHQERFSSISRQIQTGFQHVFPALGVQLSVEMNPPEFKIDNLW